MIGDSAAQAAPQAAHVLLVDDDAAVRGVIRRVLALEGYTVAEAATADDALVAMEGDPLPTVVVSDIHMPDRDGISLLREVHRRHPDTAVVMLTGDADITTAVACLKLGAVDYLTKPVIIDEVRARIARAIETRRLTLEVRRLEQDYRKELERRVTALSRKNQSMFLAQVQMAVRMLEAKDPYTRGHSQRVANYSVATARMLGLDLGMLGEIRLGGELHDIGKIGTRDAVLHKTGLLSVEELAEIRRHTTDGEEMLGLLRGDHPEVLHIVRSHHERIDGSGFPDGLVGDAIPLSARIVSVVDAFDAMTSTRAYRTEQGAEPAFRELDRCAGKQFDPNVVKAFRAAFPNHDGLPLAV